MLFRDDRCLAFLGSIVVKLPFQLFFSVSPCLCLSLGSDAERGTTTSSIMDDLVRENAKLKAELVQTFPPPFYSLCVVLIPRIYPPLFGLLPLIHHCSATLADSSMHLVL